AFNQSYDHFLRCAEKKGIEIIIARYTDYSMAKGHVRAGWKLTHGYWEKVGETPVEFVYDKFPATDEKTRAIKENLVERGIGIFNDPSLENFFKDKAATQDIFPDLVPYTLAVNGTSDEMMAAIEEVRGTNLHTDLSTNEIVMKPRRGHSGKGIFVIDDNYDILKSKEWQNYIVQPFLETSDGIPELGITGRHDLRVIIADGKPRQAYLRMPPEGGYISSMDFGGEIQYVNIEQIPSCFLDVVRTVDSELTSCKHKLYSIDMALGKSGKVWMYELNGKPGQVWDPSNPEDIEQTQKLHEIILDTLIKAVNE
ncbi:MAG: hypothetical protein KAT91_02380, partial [Candidatus Aenigmarchaeota archaeon]|nr:hypothetical protein [Candidatus Aenigmarchaeota archaeon]